MRQFRQIDVFSDGALTGNPLAVVTEGDGLSGDEMQAFARWTNLSETTFLLAPSSPRAHYRVRIFTPDGEMDFAGHPTLGSCHAWLEVREPGDIGDRIIQECSAGLVEVRQTESGLAFAAPPLKRAGPLGGELTRRIVELLRISPDDVLDGACVDNGAGWAGVLLRDAESVLTLAPDRVDLDIGVIGRTRRADRLTSRSGLSFPKHGATAEDPAESCTSSRTRGRSGSEAQQPRSSPGWLRFERCRVLASRRRWTSRRPGDSAVSETGTPA
ncbi:MAG: PhzF family phenazine biosynthesis protein [Solirubrobacteraceae bacterium]